MIVFDEIIKLYKEIYDIYHKMLKLENERKIESKEFRELINLLKYKISKENMLFNIFINNYENDYEKMLELIESQEDDFEEYISRRLYDYMSVFEKNDISLDKELFTEKDIVRETTKRLDRLYDLYSGELYLIYLSFMNDYISSLAFHSIKKYILGFKYNDGLGNHDIELKLIENNFNIPKVNYIDINAMAVSLGVGPQLSNEIKLMVCDDAIRNSVMKMIMITDVDYNDEYMKSCSIISSCMLRASLLLLNDDKDNYNKEIVMIEKMILESGNFYNGLSIDIINSIINNVDKDKKRVRKISVKSYD